MSEARLSIEGRTGNVTIQGDGPWRIGRSPDADVSFAGDRSCSREQARVVRSEGGFLIEPLSRTVPTALDGEELSGPAKLRDGAVVSCGAQRMVFTLIDNDPFEATTIGRAADMVASDVRRLLPQSMVAGRQAEPGQLALDHPAVSRRHASFERTGPGAVTVRDLGSTNGTFVNGRRIDRPCLIYSGDRVDIGPFQLTFDGDCLETTVRSGKVELTVGGVSVDVKAVGGARGTLRILDRASFQIRPRELVCLIGASGSGKSTLMNVLSGRSVPSTGTVLLNGMDLHATFEALKQDIAFVPQQDVLHEQLTLRQALDYSARLRLPRDTSAAQRREVVEAAAASVDLSGRLATKIALLSGGQKKRASLASEILKRPSLLFLDEVTSGLDESTDWEIMKLLRRLAEEGMTIVLVTHTLANLEAFCHKAVCMGVGGYVTFVGAPDEALRFFGVPRLGGIFERMQEGGPRDWRARFEEDALPTAVVPPTAAGPGEPAAVALPREGTARKIARIASQCAILVRRNAHLLVADRQGLMMAAVQSILVGGLTGYVFGDFGGPAEQAGSKVALMFLLGLTAFWLGCNGASKEIVGELPIYRRERDNNLSPLAFVLAKYLVGSVYTVLQFLPVLALTALLAEAVPGGVGKQLATLLVGALAGTATGLAISAFCDTRDQATTIVPLVLVPQIILAGVLVPHLPTAAEWVARLTVSSYWITDATKQGFLPGGVQPVWAEQVFVLVQSAAFLGIAYVATLWRHGRGGAR